MTYEVTKRIEDTAKKADINARNIIVRPSFLLSLVQSEVETAFAGDR